MSQSEHFDAGYGAAMQGKGPSACPYAANTEEASDWRKGHTSGSRHSAPQGLIDANSAHMLDLARQDGRVAVRSAQQARTAALVAEVEQATKECGPGRHQWDAPEGTVYGPKHPDGFRFGGSSLTFGGVDVSQYLKSLTMQLDLPPMPGRSFQFNTASPLRADPWAIGQPRRIDITNI